MALKRTLGRTIKRAAVHHLRNARYKTMTKLMANDTARIAKLEGKVRAGKMTKEAALNTKAGKRSQELLSKGVGGARRYFKKAALNRMKLKAAGYTGAAVVGAAGLTAAAVAIRKRRKKKG